MHMERAPKNVHDHTHARFNKARVSFRIFSRGGGGKWVSDASATAPLLECDDCPYIL